MRSSRWVARGVDSGAHWYSIEVMANEPNYDQIAFDMAFTHLAAQGKVSADADGDCKYRTDSGLACAIGCLINDEDAGGLDSEDGVDLCEIEEAVSRKIGGVPAGKLMMAMQKSHDTRPPWEWRSEANRVAEEFNLSTATIDALDWSACEATG